MKTLLLIMILPEMFFLIRRKISLTDKLTLIRHVIVTLYSWILTPFLFARVHELTAGGIMFIFTLFLNYLFIIILGSKRERSIFISAAEFFWKTMLTISKNIVMCLIIILEGKVKKSTMRLMIGLLYVDKKNLVSGTIIIFDPFLFMVRYLELHSKVGVSRKKIIWMITIISLIATIWWASFIYFTNIRL
ncbi:MAG: hypothetical protein WCI93_01405 [bacterium]